jgi:hypothetical protein
MRVRIFSQFADLEGEAEKKAEEVYRDLGHRYPGVIGARPPRSPMRLGATIISALPKCGTKS